MNLAGAVDLAERDANDDFFYVAQREGLITRHSYDSAVSETVLDIRALTSTDNERGLLGITFQQNKKNQWHLYVNYTNTEGNTEVVEYLAHADGTIDAATRRELLTVQQPYANHNGGGLAIGPDNMLYISLGDGGSANDPERRAQDLTTLLGKLLRINPAPSQKLPYSIPTDNPFVNTPHARPEIWSVGLRNPWRFTFAASGDLWIADVGQNTWEEIDHVRFTGITPAGRGVNFGWSGFEGSHRFNADQSVQNHVPPIFEYEHVDGECSISGAAMSTATNLPKRPNRFFFGDFCSGIIRSIAQDVEGQTSVEKVATGLGNVTAVRSTSRGIYVLTLDGPILEIHTS
jgi:glucose/arabinose dehydrogenase